MRYLPQIVRFVIVYYTYGHVGSRAFLLKTFDTDSSLNDYFMSPAMLDIEKINGVFSGERGGDTCRDAARTRVQTGELHDTVCQ